MVVGGEGEGVGAGARGSWTEKGAAVRKGARRGGGWTVVGSGLTIVQGMAATDVKGKGLGRFPTMSRVARDCEVCCLNDDDGLAFRAPPQCY